MSSLIYKIHPFHYIHVLDTNSNKTRLEIGPQTYVKQENEKIIFGPEKMLIIPPRNYCVIENPVVKDKENKVEFDENGTAKLAFADLEIRFSCQPFPLYPGEILKQNTTPLKIIPANSALRLKAILDFVDENGLKRIACDEWLFEGPSTYIPRKEIFVEEQIKCSVIKPNQAIKLRARKEFTDRNGVKRVTGEEWIVKKIGAYFPDAYEDIIAFVDAYVLTEKKALHLRANCTFVDDFNKKRLNGEEWLITFTDTDTYIPNVYEDVINEIMVTILNSRQYTVILDPVDSDGKTQLGKKKLVKGEKCFFLQPGEKLEKGVQDIYVLMDDEGLVLKCIEAFDDELKVKRVPGYRWIIKGPTEYIPPVGCEVVSRRKAIPLSIFLSFLSNYLS